MPSSLLISISIAFASFVALPAQAHSLPVIRSLQNPIPEWPSLRLNFTLKHSSIQIYGHSVFSMVASPNVSHDSSSVLYDAFAVFTEGSTSYNYTLADGIAYISRESLENIDTPSVRCLDSDALPPINSIVSALNNATVLSNASKSGSIFQCSSENLFKVSVNGFDFAVCYSASSGFVMHGSTMDIEVEYLENRVKISTPTVDMGTERSCVGVASSSAITSVGSALLTGQPITQSAERKLEADVDFSELFHSGADSCSCKSTPRPCIFIHGLGISDEKPENVDTYPKYWGDLTDHAPCCTSMKYAVLNTLNNSWTSDTLKQKVCDRMLAVSETKQESTISDTIVITHSMGGLMVAGALATGQCSFANSTSWVALAAPMRGSMASDHFQDSCKDNTNFFMEAVVECTGFCPAGDSIRSLAYAGERYSTDELNQAYEAAQEAYRKNATGILCSNSFSGLVTTYEFEFWTMGLMVPHKSDENDGMVEFYSCAAGIPESEFGNTYLDRYYVTTINHGDASFRANDALIDKAKMPKKVVPVSALGDDAEEIEFLLEAANTQ